MMPSVSERTLFRAGHNCWRVERADRFSCIQDAADYFRLVRQAILDAQDTVFIVGWDIQATLDLVPGGASDGAPTKLDELLKWVVRRKPRLRCYILIWDYAELYALERDPFSRWRLGWRMPKQIRFGFDGRHPIGGSHHQKIVLVDDALVFSGGIDLTGHRWDTPAHRLDEPLRLNANGTPYEPYHEIQAMADGQVAIALGDLVRERWHALGETPRPRTSASTSTSTRGNTRDPWPRDVVPDLTDVDVAIARTMPPSETEAAIRECEQLYIDTIAAAERSIYIESQYFTNDMLGRALAERLQEPDGPEVLAVIPKECTGWLEQQTMGVLRDEVLRHLAAADRYRRLRIVYPAASRSRNVSTFIHSKVMIVDDRLVRIGSANFSRRSMGVDSECDVAAEAKAGDEAGVLRIRDRLIGEHLGMSPGAVASELARLGSMRALIDARGDANRTDIDRTLLPVKVGPAAEAPAEIVKAAADPEEPIDISALTDLIVPFDARVSRRSRQWWPWAIIIAAAVLAAWLVMLDPGWSNGLIAAAIVLGACVFAFGLRSHLLLRRYSRSERRHRERAEFG